MREKGTKSKLLKLRRLGKKIGSCEDCGLCESRISSVPGHGSVNASIVFIGEAPGKEEDKSGMPFVGASGKRLRTILNVAGIKDTKIFITNVVKCRPPYNRVPHSNEIKNCVEWLEEELDIVNPLTIIPLGSTAMKTVFSILRVPYEGGVTFNRGKKFKHDSMSIFPTFHPSYVLRHRELAKTVRMDIKRAISSTRRRIS